MYSNMQLRDRYTIMRRQLLLLLMAGAGPLRGEHALPMILIKRPVGRRAAISERGVAFVAPQHELLQNYAEGIRATLSHSGLPIAPSVD